MIVSRSDLVLHRWRIRFPRWSKDLLTRSPLSKLNSLSEADAAYGPRILVAGISRSNHVEVQLAFLALVVHPIGDIGLLSWGLHLRFL